VELDAERASRNSSVRGVGMLVEAQIGERAAASSTSEEEGDYDARSCSADSSSSSSSCSDEDEVAAISVTASSSSLSQVAFARNLHLGQQLHPSTVVLGEKTIDSTSSDSSRRGTHCTIGASEPSKMAPQIQMQTSPAQRQQSIVMDGVVSVVDGDDEDAFFSEIHSSNGSSGSVFSSISSVGEAAHERTTVAVGSEEKSGATLSLSSTESHSPVTTDHNSSSSSSSSSSSEPDLSRWMTPVVITSSASPPTHPASHDATGVNARDEVIVDVSAVDSIVAASDDDDEERRQYRNIVEVLKSVNQAFHGLK
jgi:hypothetical protein